MALTQEQAVAWADGFLNYIGAPASGAADPRVAFLAAQVMHEGTAAANNPLAIEDGGSDGLPGNTAISQFNNVDDGYKALGAYLSTNTPEYLAALRKSNTDIPSLAAALAQAQWEGSATPKARTASAAYAQAVASAAGDTSGAPITNAPQVTAPAPSSGSAPAGIGNVNYATQAGNPAILKVQANYTGPGAYKGFDISKIPTALRQQTINAIDAVTANPTEERNILNDIMNHYGEMSWIASDPEVLTVLVSSAYNSWATKDPATYQSALIATDWWKNTSDNQRLWQETQANDPGQAHAAVLQAQARVTNIANTLGVQLTAAQLNKIATVVVQQSVTSAGQFSNTAFTDQQIYQAITGAINTDQITSQLTTAQTNPLAATATTAGGSAANGAGDATALYNAFTTIARNYYLNLTPSQIAGYVQKYLSSDTGQGNFQTGAVSGFTTTAENIAKQMYPALASAIGTSTSTGTDETPYQSLAWARNMIAQYTGLGSGDNVDLTSPQWSWILSGSPPPSNVANGITQQSSTAATSPSSSANGSIPSSDVLQKYLMQSPQYQTTDMAKTQAWQVGRAITAAFGY